MSQNKKNKESATQKEKPCQRIEKMQVSLDVDCNDNFPSLTKDILSEKMDVKENSSICYVCGKIFKTKLYLNKHLKNIHKINNKVGRLPNDTFKCSFCDKGVGSKRSLERHINLIHLDHNNKTFFECVQCDYKTSLKQNLKRHNKKHEKPPVNRPFKCTNCKARFSVLSYLKYHERKVHGLHSLKIASIRRKCPMCSFVSTIRTRQEIYNHFKEVHNIPLRSETYYFDNMQLFHSWKNAKEKETKTYYRKTGRTSYVCHRSGIYKSESKNIRHPKMTVTCKIDSFCPSIMSLNVQNNGHVEVKYVPCHVGHKNELEYIRLSREERREISSQLVNKTPHDVILTQIRTSLRNCDMQRIHFATKKDIRNIENSLNRNNEAMKHSCESVSVEACMKDWKSNKTTSLLYLKLGEQDKENTSVTDDQSEKTNQLVEQQSFNEICVAEDITDEETVKRNFSKVLKEFIDYCTNCVNSKEQITYLENFMRVAMSNADAMETKSQRVIKVNCHKHLLSRGTIKDPHTHLEHTYCTA